MAITKSAKKAAKRSKVLAQRNSHFKIRMKMGIKSLIKKVAKWEDVKQEQISEIYKSIDKAEKVGILKKNTAARKKSRVARIFNKTLVK